MTKFIYRVALGLPLYTAYHIPIQRYELDRVFIQGDSNGVEEFIAFHEDNEVAALDIETLRRTFDVLD